LGLSIYETQYRIYAIDVPRFWQIDPKAEDGGQESWSPYHYSFNNPIRYNDPKGDLADCTTCPPNSSNSNLPVPSDPKPSLPERIVKGVGDFIGNALSYITSSYRLEMEGSFGAQIGGNIDTKLGQVGVEFNLASVEMVSMTVEKKANEITPKITHHYHNKKDEEGNPVVRFTHKLGINLAGIGGSISVSHDYHKQADGSSKQGTVKVKTTLKFMDYERETEIIAKPKEDVKIEKRKAVTTGNSFMLGIGYEIKASKVLEEKKQ
jgi:RHS repeat-associated protein